jgi:hypothetical protein
MNGTYTIKQDMTQTILQMKTVMNHITGRERTTPNTWHKDDLEVDFSLIFGLQPRY